MGWSCFITWIRHPRMVAWFVSTGVAWVAARLPFARACFLPEVAEFMPGFVIAPLAGLYAGPAGVAGIVAGTLAGDLALGQWGAMTGFRTAAYGLASLYMMVLAAPGWLTAGRAGAGRIALALVPVCLGAAAWISVGGALRRFYPFAYLLMLNAAQFLVFAAVFAPAAIRLLAGHWAPRFGAWRQVMGLPDDPRERPGPGRGLIWLGALLACVGGTALSGWVYGIWPVGRPWLGRHAGIWVTGPVLAALALQAAGTAAAMVRRRPPDAPAGRFGRMRLPSPLERR